MLNITNPSHDAALAAAEQFIANRQLQPAEQLLLQILAQNPTHLRAIQLFGDIAAAVWQMDRAVEIYRRGIALHPANPDLHNSLGAALRGQGLMHAAAAAFQAALKLAPTHPAARMNLVGTLRDQADAPAAVQLARENVTLFSDNPMAHSELLATLHYLPGITPAQLFAEHRSFAKKFEPPAPAPIHSNDRNPDRPLRIAYLSPDLCTHPVASFFEPLLETHNKSDFRITCYSDTTRPDAVTQRLAKLTTDFKPTPHLSDDQLFALIRQDQIDLLIDLAGHTFRNRLTLLARKPAPIQITWLGYPNTTGLTSVDYRITTEIADPLGSESHHTEKLLRLPHTFLCYKPDPTLPHIKPRGAAAPITLGSFNMMAKLNPPLIALWSQILHAFPTARLILKAHGLAEPAAQSQISNWFAQNNIDPSRLDLRGYTATRADHLDMYNELDLALDTYPYNGTTTTCEALAMGTPVLTLAGQTHHARVGAALLHALNLSQLVTATPDEYVARAIQIASALTASRQNHGATEVKIPPQPGSTRGGQGVDGVQNRGGTGGKQGFSDPPKPQPVVVPSKQEIAAALTQSPLTNARQFTSDLESTYRQIWRRYCNP